MLWWIAMIHNTHIQIHLANSGHHRQIIVCRYICVLRNTCFLWKIYCVSIAIRLIGKLFSNPWDILVTYCFTFVGDSFKRAQRVCCACLCYPYMRYNVHTKSLLLGLVWRIWKQKPKSSKIHISHAILHQTNVGRHSHEFSYVCVWLCGVRKCLDFHVKQLTIWQCQWEWNMSKAQTQPTVN